MDVSRFYEVDPRRQHSTEVAFGEGWLLDADPGATYTVRWIQDTHEIYALRHPPLVLVTIPDDGSAWTEDGPISVTVLGWATTRHVLDEALAGWEEHVCQPNGLDWLSDRIEEGARQHPQSGDQDDLNHG